MRARLLAALTLACSAAALLPHGPATAAEPAADAKPWLLRVHEAAGKRNFQGTFVVTAAGMVASSRIAHYCEGPNQYERLDALDGQPRRVLRTNDTVHTLWPASRVVSIEQRDGLAAFPALLQANGAEASEHYAVEPVGSDRVAGYETRVLAVKPRDEHRFGLRLWVEKDSALLLRAEVIGPHDEVLESSAFSDLALNVKPQPELVLQPLRRLDGWRVLRPSVTRTKLESEGWTMRSAVPGFEQINCLKRSIAPAAEGAAAAPTVLQSVWSDGLAYVSLFIEPFDAGRHTRPMQTAIGATHTLMRRQGDWWITVMGEVPAATLRQFAQALERQPRQ